MTLALARILTLVGYFGLLALLLNWFSWWSPPTQVPRALVLLILVVPLLFPLRGILHGKPYTHEWASFLSLFYFLVGVDTAFNYQDWRMLGIVLTILSLVFFIGCVFFAKLEKIRLNKLATHNN